MPDVIDISRYLRDSGHRTTNPRRQVWEVLTAARGHLTADQIAARVKTADPSINLASIYRSLALFTDLGLARESNIGSNGGARWELAHPDDQFHLICEVCGGVQHHGGDLVDQVRAHLDADHGFAASTVELSVTGLCHSCADR